MTYEVYESAHRLCQELGPSGDNFPLARGIHNDHNAQSRLRALREATECRVAFALHHGDTVGAVRSIRPVHDAFDA